MSAYGAVQTDGDPICEARFVAFAEKIAFGIFL